MGQIEIEILEEVKQKLQEVCGIPAQYLRLTLGQGDPWIQEYVPERTARQLANTLRRNLADIPNFRLPLDSLRQEVDYLDFLNQNPIRRDGLRLNQQGRPNFPEDEDPDVLIQPAPRFIQDRIARLNPEAVRNFDPYMPDPEDLHAYPQNLIRQDEPNLDEMPESSDSASTESSQNFDEGAVLGDEVTISEICHEDNRTYLIAGQMLTFRFHFVNSGDIKKHTEFVDLQPKSRKDIVSQIREIYPNSQILTLDRGFCIDRIHQDRTIASAEPDA